MRSRAGCSGERPALGALPALASARAAAADVLAVAPLAPEFEDGLALATVARREDLARLREGRVAEEVVADVSPRWRERFVERHGAGWRRVATCTSGWCRGAPTAGKTRRFVDWTPSLGVTRTRRRCRISSARRCAPRACSPSRPAGRLAARRPAAVTTGEPHPGPAILVVEDELVLALELESAIEAAGFAALGPGPRPFTAPRRC
jgi:hypothetical protein